MSYNLALAGEPPTLGSTVLSMYDDRWLSVDEISRYLGVSSDTIYRWIDRQSMPAHKVGRLWKFKRDEVDVWVKAGGPSEKTAPKGAKE